LAKGGKCWAEVVVELDRDKKLIDYPKALEPYDFLIVLSEEAAGDIKPDLVKEGETGFLIWDSSTITKFRAAKRVKKSLGIPIQKLAVEKFNNMVFGNSILFGIFTVLSGIFSEESAIETIKNFVPVSTIDTNLEAFELGKQEGMDFLKKVKEESE
jgi:Pyruvate/2-oxoacid:ferredoxin oxidoreductase gamma subunit